jgi:AcrR family transcriptional regulator
MYDAAVPRSARSQSLSLDEIVDAALDLLRESGLEGLTMRAVASRLGVTPMAMYYYVADKDELLRLASERVSAVSGPLELKDDDWEESLRTYLLAVWGEYARYPGLASYAIGQPNLGVTSTSLAQGVKFFQDAGFQPKSARLAWSFAMTYIHGRMSVDAHLGHRSDAPRMHGLRARDYVEFGVDMVITGLRELRAADPATAATA